MSKESIPIELKQRKQWVTWRYATRDGKQTKILFQADRFTPASSTDPKTWSTFDQVKRFDTIGFVFSKDDPYVLLDFDKCAGDRSKLELIHKLNSYTELSPSKKGYHVIVRASKPNAYCKNPKLQIEVYDRSRFATITGNIFNNQSIIQNRQTELNEVYNTIFKDKIEKDKEYERIRKEKEAQGIFTVAIKLEDDKILELASNTTNAKRFKDLFNGQWQSYFESQSEADFALISSLAFYTQDEDQLDRLFRRSKLYRTKWERPDYRGRIFKSILSKQINIYGKERKRVSCEVLQETETHYIIKLDGVVKQISKDQMSIRGN